MSRDLVTSSSPVPESSPSHCGSLVNLLLLGSATTTGVLSALFLFVVSTADSGSGRHSARGDNQVAQQPSEASPAVLRADASAVTPQPRRPQGDVVAAISPALDAGLKALTESETNDGAAPASRVEALSLLGEEAAAEPTDPFSLVDDSLTDEFAPAGEPLAELERDEGRSTVDVALKAYGVESEIARPTMFDAERLALELDSLAQELIVDRPTLKKMTRTSSEDGRLQLLVARNDELRGLPFRWGEECHESPGQTRMLDTVAAQFRQLQTMHANLSRRSKDAPHMDVLANALTRSTQLMLQDEAWRVDEAVRALEQVFQIEDRETRLALVDALSDIECREATEALARRALYDFDADVRSAAVEQLRGRSDDDYLDMLLAGFRYPWEPVAWHAADAVVQLEATPAIPRLAEILDAPDPAAPYVNNEGKWAVSEVVAINHLRNCQLCHTQSVATSDPLRGLVPIPGQQLPRVYYQSQSGDFVRANVTYLKQDFSVVQEVSDHGPWPKEQRFDFVVRERELKPFEQPVIEDAPELARTGPLSRHYPQRTAVMYALQRLGERIEAGYDKSLRVASASR